MRKRTLAAWKKEELTTPTAPRQKPLSIEKPVVRKPNDQLMFLQKTIGNQAVQRLLQSDNTMASFSPNPPNHKSVRISDPSKPLVVKNRVMRSEQCSEKNPMVKDETTQKYLIWSGWRGRCLPQLDPAQVDIVLKVENERIKALDKTIQMIQVVQNAILIGVKRYPRDPFWRDYHNLFSALKKYMGLKSEAGDGFYYDYYNNPNDTDLYEKLKEICNLLSQNLSFRVAPGRYLLDAQMGGTTGAMGDRRSGIIFPPGWFQEDPGYRLLTLTHEYFHMMSNPIYDHYPEIRECNLTRSSALIKEANFLSALSSWVYLNRDVQDEYGVIPCYSGR